MRTMRKSWFLVIFCSRNPSSTSLHVRTYHHHQTRERKSNPNNMKNISFQRDFSSVVYICHYHYFIFFSSSAHHKSYDFHVFFTNICFIKYIFLSFARHFSSYTRLPIQHNNTDFSHLAHVPVLCLEIFFVFKSPFIFFNFSSTFFSK